MPDIGIGIIGGGYMGKAHAVAFSAVGALFETALRPRLEVVAATSTASAERYRAAYGFARATADWRDLVADPKVQAVVIASPQETHRAIAEAAFAANGCMGDLAPHPVNCMLALMGPVAELSARIETVHGARPGGKVTNDDHGQLMLRFRSGAMGHLYISRIATGRKMGYAYEIHGTKGGIRFDQEDQNSVWLYRAEGPEATRGYTRILTGPAHPDYGMFCQGPGHGTGSQDQIIIEARDFLQAIHSGKPVWPTFRDGLAVSQIIDTAFKASDEGGWHAVPQP